jgi:hypothetical protein
MAISGKQFYFLFAHMSLKSFPVKLGFYIESAISLSFKILNLLFAGQHRPNGVVQFDLIVKRNVFVLKFVACLQQTIGQIIKIVSILMESVQNSLYFDTDL